MLSAPRDVCYLSKPGSALFLSSACNQPSVPLTAGNMMSMHRAISMEIFLASRSRCKLHRCNKMKVEVGKRKFSWFVFYSKGSCATKDMQCQ